MKNLKPVPADKKKSLGKLPTDVRNKMGYAQKGKMMSKRDKLIEKQNPKSEYKKDKFGKTKLSYTEAKKGKMITGKKEEDDVSKYLKSIKLPDAKDVRDVVNKKAKGGEMKKPMKAVLGAAALLAGKDKIKGMLKKKASASPAMSFLGDTAKKSMGGEMKQGYGAARTSGMGLQDEDLIPGKSMDYYKDLM
jgi:hypothetical protein